MEVNKDERRNRIMKTFLKKFERAMAAASFAEEGEFEIARQIMNEERPRKTNRPSSYDYQRPAARKELHVD
jgi:hypothetical protein